MAASVLKKAVDMENSNNVKIDMSSNKTIASTIAKNMPERYAPYAEGNTIKTFDGTMLYIFECQADTKCVITFDANGEKEPNELTQDTIDLKDQAKYILIKKGDKFEIKNPEWFGKIADF